MLKRAGVPLVERVELPPVYLPSLFKDIPNDAHNIQPRGYAFSIAEAINALDEAEDRYAEAWISGQDVSHLPRGRHVLVKLQAERYTQARERLSSFENSDIFSS